MKPFIFLLAMMILWMFSLSFQHGMDRFEEARYALVDLASEGSGIADFEYSYSGAPYAEQMVSDFITGNIPSAVPSLKGAGEIKVSVDQKIDGALGESTVYIYADGVGFFRLPMFDISEIHVSNS